MPYWPTKPMTAMPCAPSSGYAECRSGLRYLPPYLDTNQLLSLLYTRVRLQGLEYRFCVWLSTSSAATGGLQFLHDDVDRDRTSRCLTEGDRTPPHSIIGARAPSRHDRKRRGKHGLRTTDQQACKHLPRHAMPESPRAVPAPAHVKSSAVANKEQHRLCNDAVPPAGFSKSARHPVCTGPGNGC